MRTYRPLNNHIKNCPGCSGNPDVIFNDFPKDMLDKLTVDDKDRIREIYDPLFWAERNLNINSGGFEPRISNSEVIKFIENEKLLLQDYGEEWLSIRKDLLQYPDGYPYQEKMIRCNYPRIVCRCGRRLGKTNAVSVKILHKIFTNTDYKVVLFTPNISQLYTILGDAQGDGMIPKLIKGNPDLESCIVNYRQTPYPKMLFSNGSNISGYVSGSSAVRSSDADFLVLDEASFLTAKDLESVIALLASKPTCLLWASSTPQGQADWFKEKCFDPTYKRFFFPGTFAPNWGYPNPVTGKTMEEDLKNEIPTEDGYNREVLALFDSGGSGVFKQHYIDQAFSLDFPEIYSEPQQGWIYIGGVDWNSANHGTRIVIVGTPDFNKFYAVDVDCVSQNHWNQTAAIQRVKQKNRDWNLTAVYVDAGYGDSAVENIRLQAISSIDPADQRLALTLHPTDLGSNIDVIDPFTRQKVQKPLKGFMVNNAVRFFEKNEIFINKSFKKLKQQIENYQILRISEKGHIVYGPPKGLDKTIGDHDLDALMFALLGFTMEFSSLVKPYATPEAKLISNPNIDRLIDNNKRVAPITNKIPKRSDIFKDPLNKEELEEKKADDKKKNEVKNHDLRLGNFGFRTLKRRNELPKRNNF